MENSSVNVKILHKNVCVLNESTVPLDGNDLKDLITVLRDTQQKTNEFLTKLTKETAEVSASEEKSDVSEEDMTDDDEDAEPEDLDFSNVIDNCENDVSPKRAKLKKNL